MDLSRHYTHYRVGPAVRSWSDIVSRHYGTSWNTYFDHPPGYGLDATSVDHWGKGGRGDPITERVGDQVALHIIGMHPKRPVRWLIWWGDIWTPSDGWKPYSAWLGGHYDHVHVTYA